MATNNKKVSYLTVKQIAGKYPFLKEQGWRWKIFNDEEFKKKCVRHFGGNVLINETKLLEHIEESVKK